MTDTVFVSGASRGIGRAIALRLANDGYDVVVHCKSRRPDAEQVAEGIRHMGRRARVLQFDLGDRTACAFPAMSGETWDSVVHGNLDGFFNVLHPLVMAMVRRRAPGRIVTLSSASGVMGNRGQTNYSAAKAGIIGATKALALELARRQITVNCVAPGFISTEMVAGHPQLEEIVKAIPLQRPGTVEEVAAVVSFLVSPEASYITRQVIDVNGGLY
jgi:3-oxoacyl-[acyl-carrier protein] reductase